VDRTLLESAILNLVVNARDAMPQGGAITISTRRRIAVMGEGNLKPGQDVVTLTVSDTGTGMSPDVIARAFEPFFTTKEVGKGSGLGLSIVYGFAQQSGGHISINSRENEGTAITLVMPLTAPHEASAEGDNFSHKAKWKPASGRVLVVEDNAKVLEFVAAQVRSLGYAVTPASTADETLHVLDQDSAYDILFTDIVLPNGMSGVELANRMKEINPKLNVLLTSGYSEETFERHGRPTSEMPLLRKPYRRPALAQALRDSLNKPAVDLRRHI
jgi:CheY-like chemotaxis protein